MPRFPEGISRDVRLLMGARAARSLAQGALIVDFALYLKALGWSSASIGIVFTVGIMVDALMSLTVGPLSDHLGRKRFLIGYEALQGAAASVALVTANPAALTVAAIFGGFGRGVSGSSGPFAPVELAWLAQSLRPETRGQLYSLNMAIGFTGTGLGALIGALPAFIQHWQPGALAYQPLFGLALVSALTCIYLLAQAKDTAPVRPQDASLEAATAMRKENTLLAKLFAINAINGASRGLTGPLMTYWFAIRFGHGPETIGPVITLAYFVTAASSLGAGSLVRTLGVVGSVVWMRIVGLVFLILIPLMPNFWLAASLYIARSAFNRGTVGARQALTVGLVRPHRQGAAVSLGNVAIQIPRAAGPLFAGMLYTAGWLELPFYIAALFSGAYIYFYQRTFNHMNSGKRPRN